ncbi:MULTISPECIES: hypothetical protein [unclassified Phenylobacterium]|uniref:hypothetical protein n=1 Tax=unclassified Phenylobacterium TaxID=2640670 RepID=UPI00083B6173|nr:MULTISPECIES: hypothetical protein [unclassified Phenylobacterium]
MSEQTQTRGPSRKKVPEVPNLAAGPAGAPDLVGTLTALGIYLDAAERLARSPGQADKLAEALAAAKRQLAIAAGFAMRSKGRRRA